MDASSSSVLLRRVESVSLVLPVGGTGHYLIYRKRMGKDESLEGRSSRWACGGHDGFQDCRAEGRLQISAAERKSARTSLGSPWARRCLVEARSSDRQLGSYSVYRIPAVQPADSVWDKAIQPTTEIGLCFCLVNGDGDLHGGAAVLVGGVQGVGCGFGWGGGYGSAAHSS